MRQLLFLMEDLMHFIHCNARVFLTENLMHLIHCSRVAVELRCHATALISYGGFNAFYPL